MSKDWRVKLTEKQKLFVKAVVLFAVSPVYVPAVILWDNRQEFLNFYKEVWTAITFGDLDG
mgnify:CR=1 FL=1|jgi:hypothetical protein|tara:strand:- start:547 stop:729 length:183 start_codon:yes stop_codon:yes gene_type:complete